MQLPDEGQIMIVVECGECSRSYKLKPQLHGKRIKCRECGATIAVPPPPPVSPAKSAIDVECAGCASTYKVKPALLGKRIRCKQCGQPITVEDDSRTAPSIARFKEDALLDERRDEFVDERRPSKKRKKKKSRRSRKKKQEGVPAFVQFAGNVFSIEVVLVMLLQLTIVLKSANEAGGAAFIVIIVLFMLSPLIFFIGRFFYRIGVGLSEGRRSGLYWFVVIIGLRVIYFSSVGTELFEAQQGVLIMVVQMILVALVLFLYVPAAAVAINSQREYTW